MKYKCISKDLRHFDNGKEYDFENHGGQWTTQKCNRNHLHTFLDDVFFKSNFVPVPDAPVKVRCKRWVGSDRFKKGNIYSVVDDKIINAYGEKVSTGTLSQWLASGCFELVTEPATEPVADLPKESCFVDGEYHWYFRMCNPKTYVTVYRQGDLIAEGWSRCHPEDTYSAEIGVRKAREQIYRKYGLVMSRDARIKLNAMFRPQPEHYNEPIGDFLKHRFTVRPLRVKCVNNCQRENMLTINKVYVVRGYDRDGWPEILNDKTQVVPFIPDRFTPYTLADERADAKTKAQADEATRMIARSKTREALIKFIGEKAVRALDVACMDATIYSACIAIPRDKNDWVI